MKKKEKRHRFENIKTILAPSTPAMRQASFGSLVGVIIISCFFFFFHILFRHINPHRTNDKRLGEKEFVE